MKNKQSRIINFLSSLLIFLLVFYSSTISSFQNFIPPLLRRFIFIILPVFLLFLVPVVYLLSGNYFYFKTHKILAFIIITLILVWENYTLRDTGILGLYGVLVPLLLVISFAGDQKSIHFSLILISLFGMIYAFFTFFCMINEPFYYKFVYPTLSQLYPDVSYTPHPSAGFTAHYSLNGMYLANGIIAFAYLAHSFSKNKKMFFQKKHCSPHP